VAERPGVRLLGLALVLAAVGLACLVLDPGPDGPAAQGEELTAVRRDPAAGEHRFTTHVYDRERDRKLDVYEPTGPHPLNAPVIVYVHGGGWLLGERAPVPVPVLAQVQRGFIVVSVDYGLAPAESFPGPVLDVKRAVQWIGTRSDLAESPVILVGESAGGSIATFAAMTSGDLEPVEGRRTVVQGAVSIDGPQDLRVMREAPWRERPWSDIEQPPGPARDRFGPYLETAEMVAAYLGCADPQIVPAPLHPAPDCEATIAASTDDASTTRWIDGGDPPVLLVCLRANPLLPDCAHDAERAAATHVAAHGGDGDSAWVDAITDPAATHFLVDAHLDGGMLNRFLDRFRP
jgi:acetyl esterase/lipase